MAKKKFTSPLGRCKYPHLNRMDNAFGPDQAKFKTELLMSPAEAAALIQEITDLGNAEHGSAKFKVPYRTDEETGEISFKAQTQYQPEFFDGAGEVVLPTKLPQIGGGSTVRIMGVISAYNNNNTRGVSLLLNRVQLVDISNAFALDDFDAIEGGYVSPEGGEHQPDLPAPKSKVNAGADDNETYDF